MLVKFIPYVPYVWIFFSVVSSFSSDHYSIEPNAFVVARIGAFDIRINVGYFMIHFFPIYYTFLILSLR